MRHYPLFLDLACKQILLVGVGAVGRRKLRTLLSVPVGHISALDPHPPDPPLPVTPHLSFEARTFRPEDLEGKALVFIATSRPDINACIASLCRARNIWCNRADAPEDGDCFIPAHTHKGGLTLAVGTEGKSPALAKVIRKDLEDWLENRYTTPLCVMERLRPLLAAFLPESSERAAVLRSLAASPLAARLTERDFVAVKDLLSRHLPGIPPAILDELLHDL